MGVRMALSGWFHVSRHCLRGLAGLGVPLWPVCAGQQGVFIAVLTRACNTPTALSLSSAKGQAPFWRGAVGGRWRGGLRVGLFGQSWPHFPGLSSVT